MASVAPSGGSERLSLVARARRHIRRHLFVFVPFLYDEEGAKVREANMAFVDQSIQGYRSAVEPQAAVAETSAAPAA